MDIVSGLQAVSETLKLTKELRQIDEKVAVADLKLRLSDVVDGLLEAKEALQDAKSREHDLKKEIEDLRHQLEIREQLEDEDGCLFALDEDGRRSDTPYCNLCYVREEKLYRLKYIKYSPGSPPDSMIVYGATQEHYQCPNCQNDFGYNLFDRR